MMNIWHVVIHFFFICCRLQYYIYQWYPIVRYRYDCYEICVVWSKITKNQSTYIYVVGAFTLCTLNSHFFVILHMNRTRDDEVWLMSVLIANCKLSSDTDECESTLSNIWHPLWVQPFFSCLLMSVVRIHLRTMYGRVLVFWIFWWNRPQKISRIHHSVTVLKIMYKLITYLYEILVYKLEVRLNP